ncbi:iron-sulfur cluster assembly factor IBA57, mitochondrial [Oratosquilla oratoria]|uniref:iron-sulfur cluster assembly factor IBA57, mitochondrial n=1 Tax=Oratosquilla oratoria TaxID=337810 RepID=UPI003F75D531
MFLRSSVLASKISRIFCRGTSVRCLHAEALVKRSIVSVEGKQTFPFLQGLITNDVNHLTEKSSCLYAMVLNTQGRVLYDIIVYMQSEEHLLLECDINMTEALIKHLKMFRVRRKVDIKPLHEVKPWVVFESNINIENIKQEDMESIYMSTKAVEKPTLDVCEQEGVLVTRDPRMQYLGHRVLLSHNINIDAVIPEVEKTQSEYEMLRMRLGVSEGAEELVYGKCLPLEANCDFLHGISFHKGCYIGQELTARTFHTGVVRKRYMPLVLKEPIPDLDLDSNVVNENGKSVGKIRGHFGKFGIGSMRIEQCIAAQELKVNDVPVETFKPLWWPIEAHKKKLNQ